MKEEGVFEEIEKVQHTSTCEVRRIDCCKDCPCMNDGDDEEWDTCKLLEDTSYLRGYKPLYHDISNNVDSECPLRRKPVILHHPDQLIAIDVNWKVTY